MIEKRFVFRRETCEISSNQSIVNGGVRSLLNDDGLLVSGAREFYEKFGRSIVGDAGIIISYR